MHDDGGQISRQHKKVYICWVDENGKYIGLSLQYNRYLTDVIFTIISVGIFLFVGDSLKMFIPAVLLVLVTVILYSRFLRWSALYYSLDMHGTPIDFISSQKPEPIRRVRPLIRKQFLRRVGEGTDGTVA